MIFFPIFFAISIIISIFAKQKKKKYDHNDFNPHF